MKSISINSFVNILFYIYIISTLLFPTFFLNKLIFTIILFFVVINYNLFRLITITPFVVLFIFLYGFLISFFNNVDRDLSIQFLLSILVLFLIYPIFHYKIDLDRIIKISGLIVVVYTGISYLIIFNIIDLPFSTSFFDFFTKYSAGSNTVREFIEGGTISFHIGTVPFLYLPFLLFVISFLKKKNFVNFISILLIFFTIVISGSRGSILTSLFSTVLIVLYKSKLKTKFYISLILIPLFLTLFFYLKTNSEVINSKEESNLVKIGHYESFIDNLNLINFCFGEGLGAYYYSKGSLALKAQTELTPFDMIRYLGFILTFTMYFFIFLPTKKIIAYKGDYTLYLFIMLIYVINSITNPTMFNSYGLLIVLWYWNKMFIDIDKVYFNKFNAISISN